MNWNFFENHHANKLKKYSSEVSPDEIWEAIADQVIDKKKNRGGLLFLLGIGLLLSVATAFVFLDHEEDASISKKSSAINHFADIPNVDHKVKELKKDEPTETAPLSKSKKLEQKLSQGIIDESKISSGLKKTFAEKQNRSIVQTDQEKVTSNIDLGNVKPQLSIKRNLNSQIQKVQTVVSDETGISLENLKEFATKGNGAASIVQLSKLPVLESLLTIKSKDPLYDIPGNTLSHEKIDLKHIAPFSFSLGLEAGMSYSYKTYESNEDQKDYLNFLKAIETPLEGFGFGIAFGLHHSSNFYIKSGLNYDRINQRINIDENIVYQGITDGAIIELYTDKEGVEIPIIGTASNTTTAAYSLRHFNSHEFFSVPLKMGYEFRFKRISLAPEFGMTFLIHHEAKGIAFRHNDINAKFSLSDGDWYKKSNVFSFSSGLNLSFQVAERWRLGINPFLQVMEKSLNASENSLDQGFTSFGLKAGTSYEF